MVELAQWSDGYYFFLHVKQSETYSAMHWKHSRWVLPTMLPAAQLDIPNEINSKGVKKRKWNTSKTDAQVRKLSSFPFDMQLTKSTGLELHYTSVI